MIEFLLWLNMPLDESEQVSRFKGIIKTQRKLMAPAINILKKYAERVVLSERGGPVAADASQLLPDPRRHRV